MPVIGKRISCLVPLEQTGLANVYVTLVIRIDQMLVLCEYHPTHLCDTNTGVSYSVAWRLSFVICILNICETLIQCSYPKNRHLSCVIHTLLSKSLLAKDALRIAPQACVLKTAEEVLKAQKALYSMTCSCTHAYIQITHTHTHTYTHHAGHQVVPIDANLPIANAQKSKQASGTISALFRCLSMANGGPVTAWQKLHAAGFFLQLLFAGVVLLFTLDQQRFSKGLIGTACPRSCQASVTPKDFGLVMVRLSLLCALSFAGSVPMFHKADRDVLKA
eukprot:scaffold25820_cov21-Tisochrysis_lutea.AAC.2